MKTLIIRQGERVIRHELGDAPITIGREPKCDLFFSDQRLSRQHARVEATPDGVRFEDLGSRNGSYLGGTRVEVRELQPGEEVTLGGLRLSYEDDTPKPAVGDVPTVMLNTSDAAAEEDETVMLSTKSPAQDEDKTVMLTSPPPEHTPRMLKREPSPAADLADKTMQLPSESAEPPKSAGPGLAKTELLDAAALAEGVSKGAPDTMLLTREPSPPTPPAQTPQIVPRPLSTAHPPSSEERAAGAPGLLTSWSWAAKLLIVVSSVALLVYLTLAFPLVRTLGSALREESLRRGRTLLSLAAASNGAAVGEGRVRDASVDSVMREERVKDAFLIDLDGNVLAPSSRADETVTSIEGIDAELGDIRTFYLGRRGSDYVMVQPLLHRSRRVGLAVLVYEAATASASWATAVLFLAFLVSLLGVVTALVFAKRMTLEPLATFRDDVEAVVKGDASSVPAEQGFSELSELARSVNRLIARAMPVAAPAPPPVHAPLPVPVPVPVPVPKTPEDVLPPRIAAPGAQTTSKRPITAAVSAKLDRDAARFWVDQNYIVVRADEEVGALVGATATGMEGKHLIEAVAEQKLLEVILDAVNALEELEAAETTTELPGGTTLHVSATRDQGRTVVGLRRL